MRVTKSNLVNHHKINQRKKQIRKDIYLKQISLQYGKISSIGNARNHRDDQWNVFGILS
jgi:hypothetical protein